MCETGLSYVTPTLEDVRDSSRIALVLVSAISSDKKRGVGSR